jgi:hydrogenase nickel incorporation protein HypA/HybF
MHELSIAVSLAEAAEAELHRQGDAHLLAVHLKLGELSGVTRDALLFSFEIVCQNTPLEGSRLVIEDIPVLIDCEPCGAPRSVVSLQKFCCAICGAPSGKLLQGREIELSALEIQT